MVLIKFPIKLLLIQAKISKKDIDWIAYKCARNEFKKLFRNMNQKTSKIQKSFGNSIQIS